jgi:glycosyltransferase involved in cell wall biosynthesis
VLREVDFVVTVSEDLRRKALAMGASPQKSRSVINGCDLSTFEVSDRRGARNSLGLDLDAATVVYIGRKDLKKGLRELVTATAKVRTRRANLQVYLVGDGADRPQVRSAIEAHEAGAYIHDLPACSPDDVAVWMSAADVVTLPSYMEGCPNVVLEALACGRPVVATDVGGIPEIMSDQCGRLIPPRDADALAEALDSVLSRSWDAEKISSHWGRSWDTVARELMEIFDSVATYRKAAVDAR